MVDLNNCSFTGRLTGTPNQKNTPSGTPLVEFSIANNIGFGNNRKCLFINVNLWGKTGNAVFPYLCKGKNVAVTGTISLNQWTGQDGTSHSNMVLDCNNIVLLADSPMSKLGQSAPQTSQNEEYESEDDTIPF